MPYIYKITNKINGKIYIGKTLQTVEKRWQEHSSDYLKPRCEKRPLYSAMRKYGIENFIVEEIEKCNNEILSEREKYWIEYYGSFKNGYNATLGGDGKSYIDYDLVVKMYRFYKNQKKTADFLNISIDSVKSALLLKEEKIYTSKEVVKAQMGKQVLQLNLKEEPLKCFSSLADAAKSLNRNTEIRGISVHIREVCNGKRKTAYGYKWSWL